MKCPIEYKFSRARNVSGIAVECIKRPRSTIFRSYFTKSCIFSGMGARKENSIISPAKCEATWSYHGVTAWLEALGIILIPMEGIYWNWTSRMCRK